MMRISRWIILSLLPLLLLAETASARGGISLDEAVENARGRGGRVISAETEEWDGQRIHNIRVLTKKGKVKRIRIDSKSGRHMKGRPRR